MKSPQSYVLSPQMNDRQQPLVSIVTPVFNNAQHLKECIESVLGQTYQNWDYTIVNNCSSDSSLSIANEYAARDPRIRVLNNERFLPIIENHNHSIRQISHASAYCKMVFADDWLYPECLELMVGVAVRHPGVGLVGAYTMDGKAVLWLGPDYPSLSVAGSEVCRCLLLKGEYVFGTMTSLLVRSDLVRKRSSFFNERNLHADLEACFAVLQESDFGFVHQVLAFSRPRDGSTSSFAKHYESVMLGILGAFLKYGPVLLSSREYNVRRKELRNQYHRTLARNFLRARPKEFWRYHQRTLEAFGARIDGFILLKSIIEEILIHIDHPWLAVKRALKWWSAAVRRITLTPSSRGTNEFEYVARNRIIGSQLVRRSLHTLTTKGRSGNATDAVTEE